jgi:hypothetical protein
MDLTELAFASSGSPLAAHRGDRSRTGAVAAEEKMNINIATCR